MSSNCLNVADLKRTWDRIVNETIRKIIPHVPEDVKLFEKNYLLIGGADLSFIPGDETKACLAYVVVKIVNDYNDKKVTDVVYEDVRMVDLNVPYLPGYLAFREAEPIIKAVERHKAIDLDTFPDVLFVDGNGMLHPNKCGLGCHVGVRLDIPTLGVAKNLFILDHVDKDDARQRRKQITIEVQEKSRVDIEKDGEVLGCALKVSERAKRPIYISIGHKISLDTAVKLVRRCSTHKVPEPTRQADIKSREYLRSRGFLNTSLNTVKSDPLPSNDD